MLRFGEDFQGIWAYASVIFEGFVFFRISGRPRPGQDVDFPEFWHVRDFRTFLQKRRASSVRFFCPERRAEFSHMSPKTADFVILGLWCQKIMTCQKLWRRGYESSYAGRLLRKSCFLYLRLCMAPARPEIGDGIVCSSPNNSYRREMQQEILA